MCSQQFEAGKVSITGLSGLRGCCVFAFNLLNLGSRVCAGSLDLGLLVA